MEDVKILQRRLKFKILAYILLILVFIWFSFAMYEMYRVKDNKRPLICLNMVKDVEDNDEYSKTCYGILYKYREYHYKENDKISAREFTLFFKEFTRDY